VLRLLFEDFGGFGVVLVDEADKVHPFGLVFEGDHLFLQTVEVDVKHRVPKDVADAFFRYAGFRRFKCEKDIFIVSKHCKIFYLCIINSQDDPTGNYRFLETVVRQGLSDDDAFA
jgi:hypothetical protein